MDDYEDVGDLPKLARLCDELGLEHYDSEAEACETHIFVDSKGNPHECWEAGFGLVNVTVAMTPEQAVRITDADAENAKLREDLEFERSENGWAREFLNRMGQKCGTKDCPSLVAYVTKMEADNAKLRELCSKLAQVVANDDVTFRKLREIAKQELGYDFIGAYDSSLGDMDQLPLFSDHMRELGVEV